MGERRVNLYSSQESPLDKSEQVFYYCAQYSLQCQFAWFRYLRIENPNSELTGHNDCVNRLSHLRRSAMDSNGVRSQSFGSFLRHIRLQRGLAFGVIIITALLAFELFNYSTTDYALTDLLQLAGNVCR